MAVKVIWADSALADLEQIVRYIAAEDRAAARRFGMTLISRVEETALFPRKGRIVPEENVEMLREIILAPYRIIYEIADGDRVLYVLRVWHSARGAIPLR